MLAFGDPHAAGLGELEVVADLEPANRASFDALDGDAQVVQAHLSHHARPPVANTHAETAAARVTVHVGVPGSERPGGLPPSHALTVEPMSPNSPPS